jgi:hypothetical protein
MAAAAHRVDGPGRILVAYSACTRGDASREADGADGISSAYGATGGDTASGAIATGSGSAATGHPTTRAAHRRASACRSRARRRPAVD